MSRQGSSREPIRRSCRIKLNKEMKKQTMKEKLITFEKESLMKLNDDCLLHIFTFLNIRDLMKLETVSSRFFYLVKSTYSKRYRIADLNAVIYFKEKKLANPELVITHIGQYINEITLSGLNLEKPEQIIRMIPKYCKNLKVIRFDNFKYFDERTLRNYLPIFRQLKILVLRYCQVSDQVRNCFNNMDSITELDLSFNRMLTGRCLTKIMNLKYLNIYACQNIFPKYFSIFCMNNNKTLKYLNIIECKSLNVKNFNDIAKYLINLEHISIMRNYPLLEQNNLSILSNLDSLKKVHLQEYIQPDYSDDLINKLAYKDQLESLELEYVPLSEHIINALSKFTKLKELIIHGIHDISDNDIVLIARNCILTHLLVAYCCNISNDGILTCLELCPELEVLDVFKCHFINDEIMISLANILNRRKLPKKLIIYVSRDNFMQFVESNQMYLLENKDLFQIIFK